MHTLWYCRATLFALMNESAEKQTNVRSFLQGENQQDRRLEVASSCPTATELIIFCKRSKRILLL